MSRLLPYALLIKPTTVKKTEISGKYRALCHQDPQQSLDKPLGLSGSSSLLNNHPPSLSGLPHTTLQDQRQHLLFITSWAIRESEELFVTFPIPCCLCSKKYFLMRQASPGKVMPVDQACPKWYCSEMPGDGRSEQALQEHTDLHLYFPATVQLKSYKASFSPCRQVAKTTKIKTPTKVLGEYVKRPRYPITKSCVFLQISTCLFQRDSRVQGATVPEIGSSYLAAFSLAFSTQLLNPKCQLYPSVVRQGPALQLFCCKGKAKSVSLLILTTAMFTSGGMLSTQ